MPECFVTTNIKNKILVNKKIVDTFYLIHSKIIFQAYLMSVVHFLLLTLFFFNLYASILITLSCRYVIASDPDDFARIIEKLSQNGVYKKATFQPSGNMICLEGSYSLQYAYTVCYCLVPPAEDIYF